MATVERGGATVRVRAFAKINLTLRVLGLRPDGYHDLRTTFQSLALHDTLTFERAKAAFTIACDDPSCPTGPDNLVWRAAHALWQAAGRKGALPGVNVTIRKRIPLAAGLGGGSSDAVAALGGLAALWRLRVDRAALAHTAESLGADVAYFLQGGTALGVGRGDVLYALPDIVPRFVVLITPPFGVSTRDAYTWHKGSPASDHPGELTARPLPAPAGRGRRRERESGHLALPVSELTNDLQPAVVQRHPELSQAIDALARSGACPAAMTGSGSTLFGLFERRQQAEAAARALDGRFGRTIVTRTLGAREYRRGTLAKRQFAR